MLDFISDIEYVPSWIKMYYTLATLLMYLIAFIVFNKRSAKGEFVKSLIMMTFMFIFALFYCINSDYFNYRMVVENPLKYFANGTIEATTFAIATFCDGNLELFRLIVWGSSILLFYLIAKIFKLNTFYSLLLWFVFFNGIIFYARATLAMAIYFIGVAIIIKGKKNIFSLIFGAALAIASIFFHREMLIAVGLSPLLFIKITKNNYKKILIAVFIVALPATYLVISNPDILSVVMQDESFGDRFNSYQDQIAEDVFGGQSRTLGGYIVMFVRYVIYYIMIYVIARAFFKVKKSDADRMYEDMRKVFQLTFGLIIIATIFFIVFGYSAFFYRTLFIAAIPLSLLLC